MITQKSQSRVREIFNACLQQGSHQQRCAVLDRECEGDAELRGSVLRLLEAHDASHSFLEQPLDHLGSEGRSQDPGSPMNSTALHSPDLAQLPSVGNYKLLELLGEGGMGVVYMAQQEQPIRRLVAVKLIKPGMDSNQVIARFESERQALAVMNHPNIAKVLDAGASSSGSPYFVMELVRGKPITEYCDHHNLGLQERLELFANVCDAVHHAHQKGIIHRDLKPTNILVELDDVRPIPKVIDFGVAKSISQTLVESTLVTGLSQMIGTPLYMSPEQAQLHSLDVDTRSDVYSLGVVLYELLTGCLPFDHETLKRVGLDEFRRVIREDDPPRPSTCISTLNHERASTVSETRQTDSRHLSLLMKRELDWIVLKSLEKDRNRRYQSAHDFSDDIRRFLSDEPVKACPPNWHYRMGKWARRRKVLLTFASLALVSLTGGTGVSVWYSLKANQSLVIANDAERLANQRLDQVLRAQAETNRQANLVERAASVIVKRDINQAEELMRRLLDDQEKRLGMSDPTVIATINRLGVICDEQGRLAEGEAQYRRAIERCKVSESAEPDTLLELMENLAGNLNEQGRYQDAEAVWRQVAERYRDRYGNQHRKTESADIFLGITLSNQFRYEEAIVKYNELLQQVAEHSQNAQALRWAIARCQDKLHKPLDYLYYERGVGYCKQNKWSLAFGDFREAMRTDPENTLYWYTAAVAAIHGSDTAIFLQHCEELLRDDKWRFEDPNDAYWTIQSLVLHPKSTDDWEALIAKASPVLNASKSEPAWKATIGAAMCRGRKFQEASDLLRTVVEQEDYGIGRLWLAVSLWNLGDRESAREELRKAERQLAIFHIDADWYLREGEKFLVREFRSELVEGKRGQEPNWQFR